MPPSDQGTGSDRIDAVIATIIEMIKTDTIIRVAIQQGRKADVTFYFHRGEVARPPRIELHPVEWQ